ncbi:MAG: hypothetical protein H0S79_26715, partial [Anaerolineaceae bacterium]|nr:hypothetical protein [Anaerolineaceae bacterium]
RFFAILMALAGVILVLIKMEIWKVKFIPAGESEYMIAPPLEEVMAARKAAKEAAKAGHKEGSEEDTPPNSDE